MTYAQELLVKMPSISGNLDDLKQVVELVFYPKTPELSPKIALYMYKTNEGIKKGARISTYFSSHEQFIQFLENAIFSLGYFMVKKQAIGDVPKFQINHIVKRMNDKLIEGMSDALGKKNRLWIDNV